MFVRVKYEKASNQWLRCLVSEYEMGMGMTG